jgi:SAM-dependent methyltransferase
MKQPQEREPGVNIMNLPDQLKLQCLICQQPLDAVSSEITCSHCGQSYRQTAGIVDFRHPTHGKQNKQQQKLVDIMCAQLPQATYEQLLDLFFAHRDFRNQPPHLIDHYRQYIQKQLERGYHFTTMFLDRLAAYFPINSRSLALEIGCGTGASLISLASRYDFVVGIEPNLPTLLLARKALAERNIDNVWLIQGYGQHLPFADACFDYVTAQNVLEHVFELDVVIADIARVLRPQGTFAADSRNRFDLFLPEPHVKIRWVGFLPRRLAFIYVKWRTGTIYDHTRLLSYFELRRALRHYFGRRYHIVFPDIAAYGGPPAVNKLLYKVERIPILGPSALIFFPTHLVLAQR